MFKKILISLFLFISFFININMALANNYNNFGLDETNLKGQFGNSDIPSVAGNALRILIGLSATVMLVMIIWSGFEIMFSKGKSDKIQAAIQRIVWTAVGIIIIISAYAISQFVINQIKFLAK